MVMRTNMKSPNRGPSVTFEGTPAKQLSNVDALRRALSSCLLWENEFYEEGEAIADRIKRLTLAVDPEAAAGIARDARNLFKLRHAPLWVARWLASGNAAQKAVVSDLLRDIIQRPDELTEFLALYWKDGKTPIAASVKRGLAAAFQKFDAYALAKYDRDDDIKLRDVLFLVHPTPKDAAQQATWDQLTGRTLPIPDTWEVALSSGADKRATWTRLLEERKLGALALLRNLRNMQEVKVDEQIIRKALSTVNVDRVLPFRFIAAAHYAPRLERDLEACMFRCLADWPKLQGRTALVVDTSPSMWQAKVSSRSELTRFDAAAALAILCREICEEVDVYAFNTRAYEVPARNGFALRDALASTRNNASCGGLAVAMANQRGYDRIVVLTDGQWHYESTITGQWEEGPAESVSPAPLTEKAYLINVASAQNAIGSKQWHMIDGWSESIIEYVRATDSADSFVAVASLELESLD
jgi:hypothetical protein